MASAGTRLTTPSAASEASRGATLQNCRQAESSAKGAETIAQRFTEDAAKIWPKSAQHACKDHV